MKKILFLSLLASVTLLTACQKDSQLTDDQLIDQIAGADNKSAVTVAELPGELKTYVDDNHFETYIEEAYRVDRRGFEVILGDENRVYCDERGRILRHRHGHISNAPCGRGEAIRPVQLPATVTDYITENYPGAEVQRAKQMISGYYFVKIDEPGYILIFDGDGVFVEATVLFYRCRPLGTPVDLGTLPEAVTNYIAENFTGAEIKIAFQKNNGMYIVGITTPEGRKIVGFDENGAFLFVRP
jgi:hypothetical protein